MACLLTGAKPLSEPMLEYCHWTLRNKVQWNINRNSCIFIQENASEIVVWKMAAILSRPQCVNILLSPSGHNDNNILKLVCVCWTLECARRSGTKGTYGSCLCDEKWRFGRRSSAANAMILYHHILWNMHMFDLYSRVEVVMYQTYFPPTVTHTKLSLGVSHTSLSKPITCNFYIYTMFYIWTRSGKGYASLWFINRIHNYNVGVVSWRRISDNCNICCIRYYYDARL